MVLPDGDSLEPALYQGLVDVFLVSEDFVDGAGPPFCFACVQQSWTTRAGVSQVTVIASEPCS